MENLVEIAGLGKTYKIAGQDLTVLRDLDMEVEDGEMVAVMGASGSGKSTLLHILGCLDRQTAGQYRLAGRDASGLDDDERSQLRSQQIGFIFQNFHLLPQLSVFENVELAFLYSPAPPQDVEKRIVDSLTQVGLSHRLQHKPAQLSGGEMQRVAIARALVTRPRLILADEPTGNLDSATGMEILTLLRHLNDNGATLLLVTHNLDVARQCARTLVINDGRFCH